MREAWHLAGCIRLIAQPCSGSSPAELGKRDGSMMGLMRDVNLQGGDIGARRTSSLGECHRTCTLQLKCIAFTFITTRTFTGPRCWLKQRGYVTQASNGTVSGLVRQHSAQSIPTAEPSNLLPPSPTSLPPMPSPAEATPAEASPLRWTYATLVTTSAYLPGVSSLACSLRHAAAPLTILSNASLLAPLVALRQEWAACGTRITITEVRASVVNPYRVSKLNSRFAGTLDKLHLWSLPHERVIFVDADMLLTRPIDELFRLTLPLDTVAAVREKNSSGYNSGLLVLSPSPTTYRRMLAAVGTLASEDGGDQGFLFSFFRGHFLELPQSYNTLKRIELEGTTTEQLRSMHRRKAFVWACRASPGSAQSARQSGFTSSAASHGSRHLGPTEVQPSRVSTVPASTLSAFRCGNAMPQSARSSSVLRAQHRNRCRWQGLAARSITT